MKYVIMLLILTCLILSGCASETRTFPSSVEYNNQYDVIKVNPDSIYAAHQPVLYNNNVIYVNNYGEYFSYDLTTKKTSKSNKEIHTLASDEYHKIKYDVVTMNGLNIQYKDPTTGKIILDTSDNKEHRYGIGKQYIVWSDYYVGAVDKIHVMKISDQSIKEIVPSQEFVEKSGYYEGKTLFTVSELGVYQNKIIVQSSKCIYIYDAESLKETKILCDENLLGIMKVYDNNILVEGDSANKYLVGKYITNDAFLINIQQ